MKTKILAVVWLPLLLSLFLVPLSGHCQTQIRKQAEDHFEVILNRSSESSVTLLQATDLHLGKKDFWKQDLSTFKRIRRLVEMYNPDMVVVTGDLLTGEKYFGSLLAAFALEFFDGLKRPWLYTFGNHDVEGGFDRDQIYEVFSTSPWCILGHHKTDTQGVKKYDYVVDVKQSPHALPAWQIFAFDTGSEKGFKSIKADQLGWFETASENAKQACGHTVPAIAVFHIPLKEYQALWVDASIPKMGESKERVSFEEDDGSPYRAFVRRGNVKATFCGHDHYNNYWGKTADGIVLAYGYISGEATRHAWPTGGKLIRLPIAGGELSIANVTPRFPDK